MLRSCDCRNESTQLDNPGILAILTLSLCLFPACHGSTSAPGEDPASPEERVTSQDTAPARVTAIRVQSGPFALSAEGTGHLKARRHVEIQAENAGKVVDLRVTEGDRVNAGDLLLHLDDREQQIEVEEARAELLSAQASFALFYQDSASDSQEPAGLTPRSSTGDNRATDLVTRAQERYDQGLISRRELDAARRDAEMRSLLSGERREEIQAVRSGVLQAEQRLARARLSLQRTRVTAPFSGTISNLQVDEGQYLTSGEPCLNLLDDSRLTVEVRVLESTMVRLQKGASARVRIPALGGKVYEGSVVSIDPQIDPDTGTGRVTVLLANPQRELLAGLFAFVELETSTLPDRITVPEAAILERDGRQVVFRIQDDVAEWLYVTAGARTQERVEIVEGLEAGDVIAIDDHFTLAHQARVEAVMAEDSPN